MARGWVTFSMLTPNLSRCRRWVLDGGERTGLFEGGGKKDVDVAAAASYLLCLVGSELLHAPCYEGFKGRLDSHLTLSYREI